MDFCPHNLQKYLEFYICTLGRTFSKLTLESVTAVSIMVILVCLMKVLLLHNSQCKRCIYILTNILHTSTGDSVSENNVLQNDSHQDSTGLCLLKCLYCRHMEANMLTVHSFPVGLNLLGVGDQISSVSDIYITIS